MSNQISNNQKEKNKTLKQVLIDIFDLLSFLIFVGGVVLLIKVFVFNPYTVIGQSMVPTFNEKDFIIVDKISSKINNYKRFDIIVFVPQGKSVTYIKRIIGLPGEIIKINDNKVYACKGNLSGESCEKLDETFLAKDEITETKNCGISEFIVTSGSYFVLGDNRQHSTDSRCCFGFGCYSGANYLVPENNIIGKVYIRIFPSFNKF